MTTEHGLVAHLQAAIARADATWVNQPSHLRRRLDEELGPEARANRAQVHQLIVAAEERIPIRLKRNGWSTTERSELSQLLVSARGWTPEASDWAVTTWAAALGLTDERPPIPTRDARRHAAGPPAAPGQHPDPFSRDIAAPTRLPSELVGPTELPTDVPIDVPIDVPTDLPTDLPGEPAPTAAATVLPTPAPMPTPASPVAPAAAPAPTPPMPMPVPASPHVPVAAPAVPTPDGPVAVPAPQLAPPDPATMAGARPAAIAPEPSLPPPTIKIPRKKSKFIRTTATFLETELDVAYQVKAGASPILLALLGLPLGIAALIASPLVRGPLLMLFMLIMIAGQAMWPARIVAVKDDHVWLLAKRGGFSTKPKALIDQGTRADVVYSGGWPLPSVRFAGERLWFPFPITGAAKRLPATGTRGARA